MIWWGHINAAAPDAAFFQWFFPIAAVALVGSLIWALWDPDGNPHSLGRKLLQHLFLGLMGSIVAYATFVLTVATDFVGPFRASIAFAGFGISLFLFWAFMGTTFRSRKPRRRVIVTLTISLSMLFAVTSLLWLAAWGAIPEIVFLTILTFCVAIVFVEFSRAVLRTTATGEKLADVYGSVLGFHLILITGPLLSYMMMLLSRVAQFDGFWSGVCFWIAVLLTVAGILLSLTRFIPDQGAPSQTAAKS